MRDCQRNVGHDETLKKKFSDILKQTERLLYQQRKDKNKLCRTHEEVVDCISKLPAAYASGFFVYVTTSP